MFPMSGQLNPELLHRLFRWATRRKGCQSPSNAVLEGSRTGDERSRSTCSMFFFVMSQIIRGCANRFRRRLTDRTIRRNSAGRSGRASSRFRRSASAMMALSGSPSTARRPVQAVRDVNISRLREPDGAGGEGGHVFKDGSRNGRRGRGCARSGPRQNPAPPHARLAMRETVDAAKPTCFATCRTV